MTHKYLAVVTLALFGATAGFPQATLNQIPSRIVGHPNPEQLPPLACSNPNLVEGRELFQPTSVALDTSVSPPMVYVADTGNSRVLMWKNATGFTNGQPADLVIGQPDKFSCQPLGPGTTFQSTGLNNPTAVAVYNGDLYVADSGNNRVLRFRKPASQASQPPAPDLYIGQPSLSNRTANYTGLVSAQGIFLSSGSTIYQTTVTFDKNGNLWLADAGNHRVLRFPASSIANGGGGMAADVVIGQQDMVTVTPLDLNQATNQLIKNVLAVPSGVAFDSAGRLYVSDSSSSRNGRVLVFGPSFPPSNATATRMIGVASPNAPFTTVTDLGTHTIANPGGIFFLGDNSVGVVDTGNNRILVFPPYSQWDSDTTVPPQASAVIGQNLSFTSTGANSTQSQTSLTPPATANRLWSPTSAFFLSATTELFVADTRNHRVIVMPQQAGGSYFSAATRVLGQDRFNTNSINLIEGREFEFLSDAGIAIDGTGDTPHLYVADPYNHRVLGYKDARKVAAGVGADLVIGQPDLQTALCNYPTGDQNLPTQSSLCVPTGLVVDSSGNLYVADSYNGRVLRFPAPFSQQGTLPQADLVLGQQNFTSVNTDPSASTMARPYGLAFAGNNGLVVSDAADNRVLYIPFNANGTFTAGADNGKAATKVFGQSNFTGIASGTGANAMNKPHHVSTDTDARVYVADTSNGRVLIFDQINNNPSTGAQATYMIAGLSSPEGVYVSPITGEIWVTNTNGGTSLRYPRYALLLFTGAPTATIPSGYATLQVAQDQYSDLFVADSSNRIAVYYPGVTYQNAANYLTRPLAPGMIATLYPSSGQQAAFSANTVTFDSLPNPLPITTNLGDTSVMFNGTAVPLYFVSPGQINFLVPMNAPTSGNADLLVVRPSTGQVLAAGLVQMTPYSPAIFMCPANQVGKLRQACILNQDGTVNGPSNPALRGSVISIYGTGQGYVPGAPADGSPASGPVPTPTIPTVVIGTASDVNDVLGNGGENFQHIQYSGLAPGLVGVWQLNVQIPMNVPPANQQPVGILLGSVPSFDVTQYITTVAVK
jgi:uncharacterized protein (TIGR03437 family)